MSIATTLNKHPNASVILGWIVMGLYGFIVYYYPSAFFRPTPLPFVVMTAIVGAIIWFLWFKSQSKVSK